MYDGGGDTAHGPGYGTSPKRLSEIKISLIGTKPLKNQIVESPERRKSSKVHGCCRSAQKQALHQDFILKVAIARKNFYEWQN